MAWSAFNRAFDKVIAGFRRGYRELLDALFQAHGPSRIMVAQLTNHETMDCTILGFLTAEKGGNPELDDFAGLQSKGPCCPPGNLNLLSLSAISSTVRRASIPAARPSETAPLFQKTVLAIDVNSIVLRCLFI